MFWTRYKLKKGIVIENDTLGTISEKINKENALIDVYVPSQNKSFITVEDEVEIVIAGLSQQEYGKLNGKIINISSDVVTNEDGVFYRVSVKPNDISLFKNNDSIELINGQIGEVRIKYESVTWMNWALKKIGISDK